MESTAPASNGSRNGSWLKLEPIQQIQPGMDLDAAVTQYERLATALSGILGPNVTVIKVRVRSSDNQKGKSGGLRVLLQRLPDGAWRRLLVYAKSDRSDVSRAEILGAIAASRTPNP